ncbi:PspC domain-containing protein [Nocardia terpenica]|uniref:PspC domain-containing protein n=1 Tax=Nocardia terpenica TaxID=455432 RepID=UPI001895539E|nr:PspC domain-containing protein [Nocardia terpenica]MBF6061796.1 PspC domain-containing protein [Nocardia terpenica]MBF6106403.1 PspC domain-containing protein [Nocardia terpenica]MBF6110216.1 PspC domain-containing protein [Nocardia terpenica]MBF6120947.1 PspC domain-containing protein [Nocardia terpenica]MBF6151552.1 PspC domain-containing protein [Nocardia terpenica]
MTRPNGWAGATGRTGFNEQLQHLWRTRPVRLPHQGPVAGVAAGFGRRFGVDPILVRVAFVVSTIFGGSGIVLYLAAWLLLPTAGDQVSPAEGLLGKGVSTQSPTKTIVLIVALGIAVSTAGPFGISFGGAGLIGFALMLAGWWLLFMRQPNPPAAEYDSLLAEGDIAATGYPGTVFPGGSPWAGATYGPYTRLPDHYEPDRPKDAAAQDDTVVLRREAPTEVNPRTDATTEALRTEPLDAPAGDTVVPGKASAPTDNSTAAPASTPGPAPTRTAPDPARFGPTPPGWDPLGVAPLAWDLPEPGPERPVAVQAPPPRRPRSRLTPVVIGLAVLAAAAAGAVAASGVHWMTPGRIAALALLVVGLGLIVGAFARRGYGLLVLLAPLAGFVILASLSNPINIETDAMGDRTSTPTTVAQLRPAYRVEAGSLMLDLRQLNLTEDHTVNVSVDMGEAKILVPASMRLHAVCTSRVGDVRCPQGIIGPPTSRLLTLNVHVRAGDAEVKYE